MLASRDETPTKESYCLIPKICVIAMLDLDLDTDPTQGFLAKHPAMNMQGHVEEFLKIYIRQKLEMKALLTHSNCDIHPFNHNSSLSPPFPVSAHPADLLSSKPRAPSPPTTSHP